MLCSRRWRCGSGYHNCRRRGMKSAQLVGRCVFVEGDRRVDWRLISETKLLVIIQNQPWCNGHDQKMQLKISNVSILSFLFLLCKQHKVKQSNGKRGVRQHRQSWILDLRQPVEQCNSSLEPAEPPFCLFFALSCILAHGKCVEHSEGVHVLLQMHVFVLSNMGKTAGSTPANTFSGESLHIIFGLLWPLLQIRQTSA